MRKFMTRLIIVIAVLLLLVVIGAIWADSLAPRGQGAPAQALPVQDAATEWDRVLTPVLAAHPDQTGAAMLVDGPKAFAARVIATRNAGRSVDVQHYIWHDDLAGRLLALELWQAAERGVRVRFMLDDMSAHGKDQGLLALAAHPNIEVRIYNPFRNRGSWRRIPETILRGLRINHRMHNKAWIVDGRVAIVGGRNIGDEYFDAATSANFHDLDLLLVGPAVAQTEAIFDEFWNSDAVVPLEDIGQRDEQRLQALVAEARAQATSPAAALYFKPIADTPSLAQYLGALDPHWMDASRIAVISDPPKKWDGGDRSEWLVPRLRKLILGAQREARLISPYFVPGETATAELVGLSKKGVDVGIVTNSLAANDVALVHGGYARYRLPLLRGGVDLHELRRQSAPEYERWSLFGSSGASLHTKALEADQERGFVGSFNLDPRSANLNTEMGVLFDDAALANSVREEYLRLARPGLSYVVELDPEGQLRWQDAAAQPPVVYDTEPNAGWGRRMLSWLAGWLPIESQL